MRLGTNHHARLLCPCLYSTDQHDPWFYCIFRVMNALVLATGMSATKLLLLFDHISLSP